MDIVSYLDIAFGWFSKGLDIVRNIILKIASVLSFGEPRFVLALITLGVSFILSYVITAKLVTKPLDTKYIIYYIIITWLIFTILFYFKI